DVHQPLHFGRQSDYGGGKLYVKWFGKKKYSYVEILKADDDRKKCEGESQGNSVWHNEQNNICVYNKTKLSRYNLHKVWDLHLIEEFLKRADPKEIKGDSQYRHLAYSKLITKDITEKVKKSWLDSTLGDWARESLKIRHRAYKIGNANLSKKYYKKHIGSLNQRVAQAGYRLGSLLNEIFDPKYRKSKAKRRKKHALLVKSFAALETAAQELKAK
ncbi:unnamed protein product, partial [marine sediment metagenome]